MKLYSKDNLYKILINIFKLKGIVIKRSELAEDEAAIIFDRAATDTQYNAVVALINRLGIDSDPVIEKEFAAWTNKSVYIEVIAPNSKFNTGKFTTLSIIDNSTAKSGDTYDFDYDLGD